MGRREGSLLYKQADGVLLWIMGRTRSDIANAVRAVARNTHNPAARQWKSLRKVGAYLEGTKDLGVMFRRGGEV